jgi:long-chain fatty acid transport protein
MKRGFLTLLAAAFLSGSAWASGYQVLLQSNRSTAMGNIGVGLRPDPSSINFNPGALAMMRQNGIQVGANLIYSKIAYSPADNPSEIYYTDNPVGTPFHLFAAFGPEDSNLKFGLGVYTPYGSTVNWGSEWIGRTSLTELSLRAIFVQPTVSYRVSDKISLGGGIIYSFGGVNLKRDSEPISFEPREYVHAELDGTASGWGYNLGVFFTPNDQLSIGINYRSRIDMTVENGTATFDRPDLVVASGQVPASTSFTSALPLPSYFTIGAAYQFTENFMLGLDVSHAGWSAYQSLRFDYADPVGGEMYTEAPRNYENTWTIKLGGEYRLVENFKLRAGGYYDQAPVQDGYLTAETPDANTVGLTGGFGLSLGERINLDGSFLYINKQQRSNIELDGLNNPIGTYKSKAFIPGISLTVNF